MRKTFTIGIAVLLSLLVFFEGSFHFHDVRCESFDSDAKNCFLCSTMGSMELQCCASDGVCDFFDGDAYVVIDPQDGIPLNGEASGFSIRAPPLS
ncbi:MAG: hypothetical protein ABIJ56_24320 [Pseudomonadota bacterium]